MTLKETIQADFVAAMKAKNETAKNTLSMLRAAIGKWEVEGVKREAGDEAVMEIIAKEVKQRRDAAEGFRKGGKEDMALKEEAEMAVLMEYLPAQMSEAEVETAARELLDSAGIGEMSQMGQAMGLLMKEFKGKADGQVVKSVVMRLLK